MDNLYWKVKAYLEANGKTDAEFTSNILLQNDLDERGDYVHTWNVSGLAQPTAEQLTALDAQATTDYNNHKVIKTRKNLYGSTAEQLEYIVENGVDAFIAKQNQIKSDNPKT